MAYYDPAFEQRRAKLLNRPVATAAPKTGGNGFDAAFQQRRQQILSQPKPTPVSTPQPIVSQPKPTPLQEVFEKGKSLIDKPQIKSVFETLGRVSKKAGNLIDTIFGKKELISPIPEKDIVKKPKTKLISKVKTTVSKLNKTLGPLLFSQYVPVEYAKPGTIELEEGVEPTAGKFVGGLIDDAIMAYIPVGGVSVRGGRDLLKEGLNLKQGIKTAAVFSAFHALVQTIKEEKIELPELLFSGGFGFLLGSFEPTVMVGGSVDLGEAKSALKKYGISLEELKNPEVLKSKFRSIVKTLHPDTGGNAEEFKVFIDSYNKVTSAGIDSKWKLPDMTAWVKALWDKKGETSEALYQKANATFREFLGKIITKGKDSVELTPKAVKDIVVTSNLKNTSLGKIMIKAAIAAEGLGKNLMVIKMDEGIKGELVAESPQGINVGIIVADPSSNANLPIEDVKKLPEESETIKVYRTSETIEPGVQVFDNRKGAEAFATKNEPVREFTVLKSDIKPSAIKEKAEAGILEFTGVKPVKYEITAKLQEKPTPPKLVGESRGVPTGQAGGEAIPKTTKGVGEEVKVKPKTVSVPKEQLPVGEGTKKISRLEARVTESLQKAPDEIKDQLGSATYKQMSKKENIKSAVEYVNKSPDEALAVLKGDVEPPQGILKNSVYVAMENQAKGDVELARRLASLSSTRMGQEISILSEIDPESPVKVMGDIIRVRAEASKKKYGVSSDKKIKKEVAKIKKQVKTPSKWDWNSFVKSIEC